MKQLESYLSALGKSARQWAEECGIPRGRVHRHLVGKRITYESAVSISEATGGAITVAEIMNSATNHGEAP